MSNELVFRRRQLLKAGAAGAGFLAMGGAGLFSAGPLAQRLLGTAAAAQSAIEAFPTSPLILNPFNDLLPVPTALAPVPKAVWSTWTHWKTGASIVPGPGVGQQDANGATHQLLPDKLGLPDPFV